jgi:hypothetical protein
MKTATALLVTAIASAAIGAGLEIAADAIVPRQPAYVTDIDTGVCSATGERERRGDDRRD